MPLRIIKREKGLVYRCKQPRTRDPRRTFGGRRHHRDFAVPTNGMRDEGGLLARRFRPCPRGPPCRRSGCSLQSDYCSRAFPWRRSISTIFVVGQELASLLHHRLFIIAKKTQHARGLTIVYPWLRAATHHGDFADGLCHCPSKLRAATLHLQRRTPQNRTYHHHGDFAGNTCTS